MGENVSEIFGEIKLTNPDGGGGGGGRGAKGSCVGSLSSEEGALLEVIRGKHWNESEKTKR